MRQSLLLGILAIALHPVVGALVGLTFQYRARRQPRIEPERLEHGADHLGEVSPQHRIRNVDGVDALLGEPRPPPLLLGAQHRDDVGDGARVVLGAGIAHRVGPAPPDPGLHGAPERHRLRHHVRPVHVDEHGIGADDVADGRQQAGRRSGPAGPSARSSSSGVWFHISLPPHTPFGVRPTVRM